MVNEKEHTILVFLNDLREGCIEGFPETGGEVVLLRTILIDIRSQQNGTQRRAQRQCVDC